MLSLVSIILTKGWITNEIYEDTSLIALGFGLSATPLWQLAMRLLVKSI